MFKSMSPVKPESTEPPRATALIGAAVDDRFFSALCSCFVAAKRAGMPVATAMLQMLAFPGSFALTMPFWLMKGQPWRAQVAIVGGQRPDGDSDA